MQYLMGIQVKPDGIIIGLYDETGKLCSYSIQDIISSNQKSGSNTIEPEEWWKSCIKGIQSVVQESKIDPSDITVIGYTGFPDSLIFIDNDGKSYLNLPINSNKKISESLNEIKIKKLKYDWILSPKDYLRFQFSGQAHTDISTVSHWGLLDESINKWSKEKIGQLNIPFEKLPTLKESSHVVGVITPEAAEITGLAMGTMVGAGGSDIESSLFGLGLVNPGDTGIFIGQDITLAIILSGDKQDIFSEWKISSHVIPGLKVLSTKIKKDDLAQLEKSITQLSKLLNQTNPVIKISSESIIPESEIKKFTELLKLPFELSTLKFPGCFGAALLVGIGGGVYLSFDDCLKEIIYPGNKINSAQ